MAFDEIDSSENSTDGAEVTTAANAAEAEGANTPPVVDGVVALSTNEDTAIIITAAQLLSLASDADGDTLFVVSLSAHCGSLYDMGGGRWLFTPAPDFNGTISLSYGISDGTDVVPAHATITVDPVNDAPMLGLPALGGDRSVNTYTTSHQNDSSVAVLADGGWIVTWASSGQDGSSFGVYAQRYDRSGSAVGNEFRVNTVTSGSQREPHVAALADGGYVVTWQSNGDGSLSGVYQQQYDAEGTALGGQVLVNETIAGSQDSAVVTGLAGGGHVVVWRSPAIIGSGLDIYVRAYDKAGNALAGERRVNSETTGNQDRPVVAATADGGYVVAWVSAGQDGDGNGIYGQRFDALGNAVGDEFQVNTYTTGAQEEPAIAALEGGGFVVAWRSFGQDGSSHGVYLQRYAADGSAVGSETLVNTRTQNNQLEPAVAGLAGGGFVVIWQSQYQDGSGRGVYGQIYDASGNAAGGEFRVNDVTAGDQDEASVAALPDGGFIVSWTSYGQDSLGDGVFQQVFNADGSVRSQASVFVEDGAAVAIAPEIQLTDIDSETLVGATVTIVDYVAGEDRLSFSGQDGITGTFDALTGRLTLSGTASLVDYRTALRSVTYENTSDNPSHGNAGLSREISFQVDDGGAVDNLSNEVSAIVEIVPVNDAPEVSGPVALAVLNLTGLTIKESQLLANASDPDGDSLSVLNLQADHGSLVDNGDGTWTFTLAPDFKGSANLTYQVSDGHIAVDASATISQPSDDNGGVVRAPLSGEGLSAEDDVFIFSADAGHQAVEDFAAGSAVDLSGDGIFDVIAFDGASGFATFDDVLSHSAQDGGDVLITLDETTSLTLSNVQLSSLVADDFRFVA